jgi:uncharacterized membrane protein YbhN (UPF0104 family)
VSDLREFAGWIETFWGHVSSVGWTALGIAVALHLVKVGLRVRAWQNILGAAFPDLRVPFRGMFGAYFAGVGVNSIAPARGGDVVKVYLARKRIAGAAYPTIAATLLVETIFDFVVAAALLAWAITLGLLPGVPDLPALPAFDWSFVVEHPYVSVVVAVGLICAGGIGIAWASQHVQAFWERVSQGFAILRDRRRFVLQVVSWQLLSWAARIGAVFFFLRAFHIEATLKTALAVLVVQSLSTLLPFTPGGLGTQQAVLLFVLSGVASTTAVLGFSVGMQLVTVAANVVVGFSAILVMTGTLSWRHSIRGEEDLLTPAAAVARGGPALPG